MNQPQGIPIAYSGSALTGDKKSVVLTYTSTMTQAQLTAQLAALQQQASALQKQSSTVNAQIANIQSQLALFVVAPATVNQVAPAPG